MKLLSHIANHHQIETVKEKGIKDLGKKDTENEHDKKDNIPDEL